MGDEDGGDADAALNLPQLDLHFLAQPAVERAEGLVEQQHLGLGDQSAGQGNALLLAARQLARLALLEPRQPDQGQHVAHPPGDLARRRAAHREAEGDVVEHGHVGKQRVVLEHHADAATAHRDVLHRYPADGDFAAVGLDKAGDGAQQGGLAAAAGAQQRTERAVGEVEGDAIERRGLAVALGDAVDLDRAHRSPPKRENRANSSKMPMEITITTVEMTLTSGVKPLRIAE